MTKLYLINRIFMSFRVGFFVMKWRKNGSKGYTQDGPSFSEIMFQSFWKTPKPILFDQQ